MSDHAAPAYRRRWTAAQIRALGARTDVPTAGAVLAGLSATQSYELVKSGRFPVPVIRVGRRLVVPVAPILRLLGLGDGGEDIRSPGADLALREPGERSGMAAAGPTPGPAAITDA